jgi:hypothetical protein
MMNADTFIDVGSTIKESLYCTGDVFVNSEKYQEKNTTFL